MAARNTTALVLIVLAVLAAAATIAAVWRGSDRATTDHNEPARVVTPGQQDQDIRPPVQQPTPANRPDADVIAPEIECPDIPAERYAEITGEWIERQIEQDLSERVHIVGRLAKSDNPDHQLAAVLMSHGDKLSHSEQVDAVTAIVRRHPAHTLAFWNLVVMCGQALEHAGCSDAGLSSQAERIDRENSEIWALLAVYRNRRDDAQGAVAAMQRAIGSASTSVYYADQILLFERAYAAASDYGTSQRLVFAVGDLAAQSLQHVALFNVCKRLAKTDLLWRRMCFDYGQMLESRARSLMTEQFGLALQEKVAELDGDQDKVDELQQQRINGMRGLAANDGMGTIFDDQVNARYLEELSVHGERAAMTFLREEIERRQALVERCRQSETAPAFDQ